MWIYLFIELGPKYLRKLLIVSTWVCKYFDFKKIVSNCNSKRRISSCSSLTSCTQCRFEKNKMYPISERRRCHTEREKQE